MPLEDAILLSSCHDGSLDPACHARLAVSYGDQILTKFSMNGREKLLTQDEWLQQHKSKFDRAGLSGAVRRQRYRDYASSTAGNAPGARLPAPKSQNSGHAITRGRSNSTGSNRHHDERHELAVAMNDPFSACQVTGYLPRVPDGTLRSTGVYKFDFNVDVFSDAEGRAFFLMDTSPFRTFAVSSVDSEVTVPLGDDGFVSQAEFNSAIAAAGRLANNVGVMPAWTENSWMIPVVRVQNESLVTPVPQFSCDMSPATGSTSLWDLAQAWRPICAGMQFKNTGKVMNREGNVAVARWPGALGLPTSANPLLVVDNASTTSATAAGFGGQGPNFASVQTLPTAKCVPVSEGFSVTWAPESCEGQAVWRPIHPQPMASTSTHEGILAYSDNAVTDVLILPDPCNGDPDRYTALIDRLYTQNSSVRASGFYNNYGENEGLYFQEFSASGSPTDQANTNSGICSFALRDHAKGFNSTNMIVDNTALIAVFEGCEPTSLIGTMRCVLGVEYIADSRIVSTGNGPIVGRVGMAKSAQVDAHHNALTVMQHVPAVVEGGVSMAEHFAGAVPRIAAAAQAVAPYAEMVLSALSALL